MKKLMCAIAATAAGVALADVSSANIVGYSTITVEKAGQQKMVGANFVSVGAEAIDIQDIKLVGDAEDGSSWVKWWNPETKKYGDKAVYVEELYELSGDPIVPTTSGWGDPEFWCPVEKTFVPGEGFWFGPSADNVGVTISGEVVQQKDVEYAGRTVEKAGQQIMVLNPFPTALDIQTVKLDGDAEDGSSWVKWWDPATKKYGDKAVYVEELYELSGDPIVPKTSGWGDPEFWCPVEKEFGIGDGFWFGPAADNVTICMPNPFYVKPAAE